MNVQFCHMTTKRFLRRYIVGIVPAIVFSTHLPAQQLPAGLAREICAEVFTRVFKVNQLPVDSSMAMIATIELWKDSTDSTTYSPDGKSGKSTDSANVKLIRKLVQEQLSLAQVFIYPAENERKFNTRGINPASATVQPRATVKTTVHVEIQRPLEGWASLLSLANTKRSADSLSSLTLHIPVFVSSKGDQQLNRYELWVYVLQKNARHEWRAAFAKTVPLQ